MPCIANIECNGIVQKNVIMGNSNRKSTHNYNKSRAAQAEAPAQAHISAHNKKMHDKALQHKKKFNP